MKSPVPEPPSFQQSRTVSARISQMVSNRMEALRKHQERKKGGSVSISDIAKQLLESARDDRQEVAELLSKPTESLLSIRSKKESQLPLSRPEWTAVSYYVQQGSEAFPKNPLSRESLATILQAFLSAYELRVGDSSGLDSYYLGNLPTECHPARRKPSDPVTPEVVKRTVAETLRRVNDPATKWVPTLAARNLYMLLEDEKLSGAAALDEVLSPYWPVLWRVAARGHYFVKREPLRAESWEESGWFPALSPLHEHFGTEKTIQTRYTLSFARGRGNEFDLLLSFPQPRKAMYPMGRYPMIAEFRAMLAGLPKVQPLEAWNGEYFFGYVAEEDNENEFWFRARVKGISFGFSKE